MIKPLRYIAYTYDLFFPRYCTACGTRLSPTEQYICIQCLNNMPYTNAHLIEHNSIEQLFWGILPIKRATSFFYYSNDDVINIIHKGKYQGKPAPLQYVSYIMAKDIMKDGFFDGIDHIIPMPIHTRRLHHRGYNQSMYIAKGISKATGIPIDGKSVIKSKYTDNQVRVSAQERKTNVENTFKVLNNENIKGKHVLLVDDVITTSSTMKSLGEAVMAAGCSDISVVSFALAGQSIII